MFQKLRERWGVNTLRVVLILCTFAIGGSLCGYAARKLMELTDIPGGILWWVLYILLVTFLWPVAVMTVSVAFGQFSFFKTYLMRMARRLGFGKRASNSKERRPAADPSDSV
jgi:hypothetical protein